MPATSFTGFPRGTRLLPVPAPLLGSLLEHIDDISELKCTLRFLWHAAQVSGAPKAVPTRILENDEVLLTALGGPEAVRQGLGLALKRGTLLEAAGAFLLNTPQNAVAADRMASAAPVFSPEPHVRRGMPPSEKPNVYALYEANVGMLTPMVADELRDAEEQYPEGWIEDAIREAAEQNKRSWRYIAAILERWAAEGRGARQGQRARGKSGRHTETLTAAEYLRRYGIPRRMD